MSLTIFARHELNDGTLSRRAKKKLNNESLAFLEALVAAGVDVDARLGSTTRADEDLTNDSLTDNNTTDLMHACKRADITVARLLIRSGLQSTQRVRKEDQPYRMQ